MTLDAQTQPIDPTIHHPSHRHLLKKPTGPARHTSVDAVIVPAARPVDYFDNAVALAGKLGTGVVAMCSGAVTADEAVRLGDTNSVPVIALDVTDEPCGLPTFSTSEFLQNHSDFARPSDTSRKRNLALLLSRLAGWERVLFLDDDIYEVDPADAQAAAGLLGEFDVVGLNNEGYPDNSVTCHVLRLLGYDAADRNVVSCEQVQFVGIGGMAVSIKLDCSFFPNIYNQDWFFILGLGESPRIGVTGSMKQRWYDPFEDPDRARREEFGDCLAEGLFWLLDDGQSLKHADLGYWREFIDRRKLFLEYLSSRVNEREFDHTAIAQIRASLARSQEVLAEIQPEFCVEYVERWRSDRDTWRSFLEQRPASLCGGSDAALEYLGWGAVIKSSVPWPTRF
jgi:hypothetical protein